jgi:hypothetical protein
MQKWLMAMPKFPLILICFAVSAFAAKERVELATTDLADVTPASLVRIEGSTGELNIVGWDEPSVQVTMNRYVFAEPRDKEKALEKLKRIEVVKKASRGEFTIATAKRESGVHVDYQIMVPRASRLVIRHHIGDIVINGVAGDIDAKAGSGDIVVQLPEQEHYAINAKTGFGGVYSEFNESQRNFVGRKLIQEASTGDSKGTSHKIDLHVDIGGISIQRAETAAGL